MSTNNVTFNEFYAYPGQPVGNIYGYLSDGWYTASDFQSFDRSSHAADGTVQKVTWTLKDGVTKQLSGLGSPAPGSIKLKDVSGPDGTPDGKIDANDIVVLGNTLPKAAGGFSINFNIGGDNWGQVDFGANFIYSIGNQVLNLNKLDWTTMTNEDTKSSYRNMITPMAHGNRYSMFDSYGTYLPDQLLADPTIAGDFDKMTAELDRINANATVRSPFMKAYVVTDECVEDGSFLRLNQLTIGYSLADKWINKAYITKCRIYLQASNLFCITKYSGFDPEVDVYSSKNPMMPGVDYSAYPRTRGFNVGVNLSF